MTWDVSCRYENQLLLFIFGADAGSDTYCSQFQSQTPYLGAVETSKGERLSSGVKLSKGEPTFEKTIFLWPASFTNVCIFVVFSMKQKQARKLSRSETQSEQIRIEPL